MLHLQIEINRNVSDRDKRKMTGSVKEPFSKVMETGTGHIAISIRECGTYDLDIGSVKGHERGVSIATSQTCAWRITNHTAIGSS